MGALPDAALRALRVDTRLFTSLRRNCSQRTGFRRAMLRSCHRIAGFQSTASSTPRAAAGVIRS
jgi:hypothetical protein